MEKSKYTKRVFAVLLVLITVLVLIKYFNYNI